MIPIATHMWGWSADSERFYFTLTEYPSDVWVMELEF